MQIFDRHKIFDFHKCLNAASCRVRYPESKFQRCPARLAQARSRHNDAFLFSDLSQQKACQRLAPEKAGHFRFNSRSADAIG